MNRDDKLVIVRSKLRSCVDKVYNQLLREQDKGVFGLIRQVGYKQLAGPIFDGVKRQVNCLIDAVSDESRLNNCLRDYCSNDVLIKYTNSRRVHELVAELFTARVNSISRIVDESSESLNEVLITEEFQCNKMLDYVDKNHNNLIINQVVSAYKRASKLIINELNCISELFKE